MDNQSRADEMPRLTNSVMDLAPQEWGDDERGWVESDGGERGEGRGCFGVPRRTVRWYLYVEEVGETPALDRDASVTFGVCWLKFNRRIVAANPELGKPPIVCIRHSY